MSSRGCVALALLAGAAGAGALTLLNVPGGMLFGAVLGSVIVQRLPHRKMHTEMPPWMLVSGLVMLGCVAGSRVGLDTVHSLVGIAFPLLGGVASLMVLNLLLAWILIRRCGWDLSTAMLACAPAGASEVAVVARQSGADVGHVLAVHSVRLMAVILVALPAIIVWSGA